MRAGRLDPLLTHGAAGRWLREACLPPPTWTARPVRGSHLGGEPGPQLCAGSELRVTARPGTGPRLAGWPPRPSRHGGRRRGQSLLPEEVLEQRETPRQDAEGRLSVPFSACLPRQ